MSSHKKRKKIVLSCGRTMLSARVISQLKKYFDLIEVGCLLNEDQLLTCSKEASGIIIGGYEKITLPIIQEFLNNTDSPIIIFLGIQYETFFTPVALSFCQDKGIVIHATGEGCEAVAKRTLDLILCWRPNEVQMRLAKTKTEPPSVEKICQEQKVLVVGSGRIGSLVAQGLLGKVKEVRYWSRQPNALLDNKGASYYSDLAHAFKGADIATLHIPATPETKGFINLELMQVMAPHSLLINAARYDLVDISSLVQLAVMGWHFQQIWDVNISEIPPSDKKRLAIFFRSEMIRLTGHTFTVCRRTSIERGKRLLELIQDQQLYI